MRDGRPIVPAIHNGRVFEFAPRGHGGSIAVQRRTIEQLLAASSDRHPSIGEPTGLKTTEVAILELLAKGLRYKEIADALHFSGTKVKRVTAHAYAKLGATSRTEALNLWRSSGEAPRD